MKQQVNPIITIVLIGIAVVVAVIFIYRGMEPQRESSPLTKEQIYGQMNAFNKKLKPGGAPKGSPPGAAQPSGATQGGN